MKQHCTCGKTNFASDLNEIEELNNAKSASEMTAGFERDHSESDALAGKHNSV